MNARQALTKAKKLWGRGAVIREDNSAPRREARAQAGAELKALRANKPVRPIAPKSQEELDAYTAARIAYTREEHRLLGIVLHYPRMVGVLLSEVPLGTDVKGTGDTWSECFEKAEQHEAARKAMAQAAASSSDPRD